MNPKEFKKWSVQKAIQEQVEKEDLYRWATSAATPAPAPKWVPGVRKMGHGFPLQVIKYLQP